jgi:hypothetical protein
MEGQGGRGSKHMGFGWSARFDRQGLSRSFSCSSSIPCLRNMLAHFACQVLFYVLRRNNPSWFNDERARNWRLPQGTITDHGEVHDDNDAERYQDQPTERATHRLAESEAENERVT